MGFALFDIIKIIGSLGFFIYGMKIMSEGVQKAAGDKLRSFLSTMTSNKFMGVFSGFLITAILQSSSATTVMTVSFVNAGLLSLVQSAGIIMGANVGTTVTAWLVSLVGFKFKISAFALPMIAAGFPLLFVKSETKKNWGEFLIGFGILFLGLQSLKECMPDIKDSPKIFEFFSSFKDPGILQRLLFLFIGTLLTIIVQSSSAATAITLILCSQGMPIEIGAAMILGENVGTTITAALAAMIANTSAKRAARIHMLFNLIGVLWMIVLLPYFISGIQEITALMAKSQPQDPNQFTLAIFHSTFNILNVILLVWFIPQLVALSVKMVPSKEAETHHLEYITAGLLKTPELSLAESQKEIIRFADINLRMNRDLGALITETDKKKFNQLLERIKHYEDITDRMEEEISDYLLKVAADGISENTSGRIRAQLGVISDLERIADLFFELSKLIDRKAKDKRWFTPDQRNNIMKMIKLLETSLNTMKTNLEKRPSEVKIDGALELERQINKYRDKLRKNHFKSMEEGNYDNKNGLIYYNLFSSLERIGDHIFNVTEAYVPYEEELV